MSENGIIFCLLIQVLFSFFHGLSTEVSSMRAFAIDVRYALPPAAAEKDVVLTALQGPAMMYATPCLSSNCD